MIDHLYLLRDESDLACTETIMIDHLYLLPPNLEHPVNMSKGMRLT